MNPQRPWRRLFWRCSHTVGGACLTSACWLLWSALAALLVLLAVVFFQRELTVPDFLLRRLEQKLEYARLSARFGRTAFDPRGNLVLENVRLYGNGIAEPLARAAAVRLHLDLWAVSRGDFDVRRIEVTDAQLDCPALVSPSGLSEPIVADLGATILRDRNDWTIPDASFHAGRVFVTADIQWHLPARSGGPGPQLPADLLKDYIGLARKAAAALRHTDRLEEGRLKLAVVGHPGTPPRIHAEVTATRAALPGGIVAEGLALTADSAWRPAGLDPATVTARAERITGPEDISISHPAAQTAGHLVLQPLRWFGGPVHFTAAAIRRAGDSATHPRVTVRIDDLPRVHAVLAALAQNTSPIAIDATVDTAARSAEVELDTTLAPSLLNDAAARAAVWRRSRILAQLNFSEPAELAAQVSLGPDWKLRQARARAHIGNAVAYGVPLDCTDAEVLIDPDKIHVAPLSFRRSDIAVRGSYDMDLHTQDYRFLVQGRFFPVSIDPWFSGWWPRLWADFKFGELAPLADLDILGRWRSPELSIVYGTADISPVELRHVPLERLRATFFIRPEHYDIISFDARRGDLAATGGFTRHDDSATKLPQWIDFRFDSSLPLAEGARLFGPEGERTVEPFVFEQPPKIEASGHMEWSAAGFREDIHASASAPGVFRFHEFPIDNVSFNFDLRDNAILVHSVAGEIAGGPLTGRATVTGPTSDRRLEFTGQLTGADLAGTVRTWMDYRNRTAPPDAEPLPDSASRLGQHGKLDLTLGAAGPLDNLYGLQGDGTATIRGAEIAEIELFGVFSRLLRGTPFGFTSLRFTDADASFAVNCENLAFSKVKFTGTSSAIHGKGRYTMPTAALNFNVALFPFRESSFAPSALFGAMLTPIFQALEIRLSGTLAKPVGSLAAGAGALFPVLPPATGGTAAPPMPPGTATTPVPTAAD